MGRISRLNSIRSGNATGSDAMAKLRVQFAIAIQSSATSRQGSDQVSSEFFMRQAEKTTREGVVVQRREPKTRTDLLSFRRSVGTSHCGRSLRDRRTKLPIQKFSFAYPLCFQSHDEFHKAIKKRDSKCDIPMCRTVCHTFPNQGTASWSNTVYGPVKYFRDISRPMWPWSKFGHGSHVSFFGRC